MKIGKVLAKLAQDKRVAKFDIASDGYQVSIRIADGYYVPNGRSYAAFQTARAAEKFIKSAVKVPTPKEGNKIVFNALTGTPCEIAQDTPRSCDPSSELYHCM